MVLHLHENKIYYIPNSSYDSSNNRLWHILHIKSPKIRLEQSIPFSIKKIKIKIKNLQRMNLPVNISHMMRKP